MGVGAFGYLAGLTCVGVVVMVAGLYTSARPAHTFMCMCMCMCMCKCICMCMCMCMCMCKCSVLARPPHIFLSVYPPTHPSIHPSIPPSIYPSIHRPTTPAFCPPPRLGLGVSSVWLSLLGFHLVQLAGAMYHHLRSG